MFASLVGLLVITVATWLLHEPSYQGRSLSQWLSMFTCSPHEDHESAEFVQASAAIRSMGSKAIPHLLARIKHEPPPSRMREDIAGILKDALPAGALTRWQEYLSDDYRLVHGDEAVLGFEALGTNAASAIPRLFLLAQSQTDDKVPIWATTALGNIGPQALPQLLQIITNQHAVGRYQAMLPFCRTVADHKGKRCRRSNGNSGDLYASSFRTGCGACDTRCDGRPATLYPMPSDR